jgi:hypothetical protein
MYKKIFPALAALPFLLTSCATPQPLRVAFHKSDSTALVIDSLDRRTCQMLQPAASSREQNNKLVQQARSFQQHQTAVVILENYTESGIGSQFTDRGTPWFVVLRGLGYEHIYFLQGDGAATPEGLPTIVQYD